MKSVNLLLMKIVIDKGIIEKHGLTAEELIVLMAVINGVNLTRAKEGLTKKGYAISTLDFDDGIALKRSVPGVDVYNNIVMESAEQTEINEDRLIHLAERMKEIYPKGKKDNTWYWADGAQVIARRLKIFFHKYDKHRKITDEQIIDATKRYVDEMLGKADMRLLKYFIFKEPVGKGGDVEPVSDLLTYIENKGQVSSSSEEAYVTLF